MFGLTLAFLIISILIFLGGSIVLTEFTLTFILISPLDDGELALTMLIFTIICLIYLIMSVVDLIVFCVSKKRQPVKIFGIISICMLNLLAIPMVIIKEDQLPRNRNKETITANQI